MKDQKGFTLVEILVVFSIFLLMASFTAILIHPHYLVLEKERFFSQFKADFLYSQQYAISRQQNLIVYILPKERRYFVKEKNSDQYVVDRHIPEQITIEHGTLGKTGIYFEFLADGGVNTFGTFYFLVDEQRYRITLQIGAGRLYVVKE
jgi:competence protein ComGD